MNKPNHTLKITIHATPGAKKTQAAGAYGDALKVRLGAAPVDGKANSELISWASKSFNVPKAKIELLHGASGRQKCIAVHFENNAELIAGQEQVKKWKAE